MKSLLPHYVLYKLNTSIVVLLVAYTKILVYIKESNSFTFKKSLTSDKKMRVGI